MNRVVLWVRQFQIIWQYFGIEAHKFYMCLRVQMCMCVRDDISHHTLLTFTKYKIEKNHLKLPSATHFNNSIPILFLFIYLFIRSLARSLHLFYHRTTNICIPWLCSFSISIWCEWFEIWVTVDFYVILCFFFFISHFELLIGDFFYQINISCLCNSQA